MRRQEYSYPVFLFSFNYILISTIYSDIFPGKSDVTLEYRNCRSLVVGLSCPMTPYERRIIHITLRDNPEVETHSEGEGHGRRVVVTPV